MSAEFGFTLAASDGAARTGEIRMARGTVRTPAFMPVGTAGTVKGLYPEQVRALGADIVLGNVYHLMLRPGAERVAHLGGLHAMMNWPHPILTDSGGFQVMSLSHIDGSRHVLTPERSIEIQGLLGSDIQMQLDECVRLPAPEEAVESAMRLSLRWAERCRLAFGDKPGRALFGIGDYMHAIVARLAMFPDLAYSVDDVYWMGNDAEGYVVNVRWSIVGTHTGHGVYGPPTGRRVRMWGISHFSINNRKIFEEWTMFNEFFVLQQLYRDDPLQ